MTTPGEQQLLEWGEQLAAVLLSDLSTCEFYPVRYPDRTVGVFCRNAAAWIAQDDAGEWERRCDEHHDPSVRSVSLTPPAHEPRAIDDDQFDEALFPSDVSPPAEPSEPADEAYYTPRVNGKPFRCLCGANVFRRWEASNIYRCNACGTEFVGDPLPAESKP